MSIEVILWADFPTVLGDYCKLEYCIMLSVAEIAEDFSGVTMKFWFVIFYSRRGNGEGRRGDILESRDKMRLWEQKTWKGSWSRE